MIEMIKEERMCSKRRNSRRNNQRTKINNLRIKQQVDQ